MLESLKRIIAYKGIGGAISASLNLATLVTHRELLGRRLVQRRVFDYRMWLDTQDRGISRTLILFGEREMEHRVLLQKIVRPGSRIFDVGANIGYYAVMEARLTGPQGSVIAVEPSPANVALLQKNIALNGLGNVTVLEGAVSDTRGTRDLFVSDFSNLNTFHPAGDTHYGLSGRTIAVTTHTIPSLAAAHGAPDLIRMDVEGHEVEIMNGMIPAIEKGEMAPDIIFEVHRNRYSADHDFAATLNRFFAAGYRTRFVGSSQRSGTELIQSMGYAGGPEIPTDFMSRRIFPDVSNDDAIDLICRRGGVRTVVVGR